MHDDMLLTPLIPRVLLSPSRTKKTLGEELNRGRKTKSTLTRKSLNNFSPKEDRLSTAFMVLKKRETLQKLWGGGERPEGGEEKHQFRVYVLGRKKCPAQRKNVGSRERGKPKEAALGGGKRLIRSTSGRVRVSDHRQ